MNRLAKQLHRDADWLKAFADGLKRESMIHKIVGRMRRAADENDELRRLFDLQWTRMGEAVEAWRAANPGNDLVQPDLGALLGWLLTFVKPHEEAQTKA